MKRVICKIALLLFVLAGISTIAFLSISPSKPTHIKVNPSTNSNACVFAQTREQILQQVDAIVLGTVLEVKSGGEWGKDICTMNIKEALKSDLSGVTKVYADPGTFIKGKTYLTFIQITDVTTLEAPYNFSYPNYQWEVNGNTLDYVPSDFSEFGRYNDLKGFFAKVEGFNKPSNKPKVITRFKSEEEKFNKSKVIIKARVTEVEKFERTQTIKIEKPYEILKNNNPGIEEIPFVYIVSDKYNIKVGDRVLLYTDGGSLLAAREGCLYLY